MDANFVKISEIKPHENAESLEIAIVSNFPCVVKKGEFKVGDWVFYIRDDSKLIGYDEYKERLERDKSASENGDFVTQDCFHCSFGWQEPLLKYLGSGGRVKTIKLRNKTSMGILLSVETVLENLGNMVHQSSVSSKDEKYPKEFLEYLNHRIEDKDNGAKFLEDNFGVKHWEAPIGSVGILNVAYQGLPLGLSKSDEENYENLEDSDLHLGSKCLVTQKYDGSSCTVTCHPDGKYEVSCRSMTFKDEEDESKMNVYQKLSRNVVKAGLWWARTHNEVIAFRGEVCCNSFNKSSFNKDCNRNDFFVYGCNFPQQENWHLKHGTYGTDRHFLKIVKECNDNGFNVKHVDILETDVIVTKDLLKKYNDRPYMDGEGVVLNIKIEDINDMSSIVWDYKSKSREYLMKMK